MWTQWTFWGGILFGVIPFLTQLLQGRFAGAVIAARGFRALKPGLDAGRRRSPWHPPAERGTRPAGTSFSAPVARGAYLGQWAFIACGALLAAVALTLEAIRAWGPRP